MTSIVLCGGHGTRLQAVFDGPKCLVDVGGRPITEHVLQWLAKQGVSDVVLCVGPFVKPFFARFGSSYGSMQLSYIHDVFRRGTGPAVVDALQGFPQLFEGQVTVPVLNGDTLLMGGRLWRADESTAVMGRDCGDGGRIKVAWRELHKSTLLANSESTHWNVEGVGVREQLLPPLEFVDVGTPEGLMMARQYVAFDLPDDPA